MKQHCEWWNWSGRVLCGLLWLLNNCNLFLYFLAKLHRRVDLVERFLCTSGTRYYDGSIAKNPAQNTLIDTNSLNLSQIQLNRMSSYPANFNKNPFVCYSKLRRCVLYIWSDPCQQGEKDKKHSYDYSGYSDGWNTHKPYNSNNYESYWPKKDDPMEVCPVGNFLTSH